LNVCDSSGKAYFTSPNGTNCNQVYSTSWNIDAPGNDITYLTRVRRENCEQYCNDNPNCGGFAWNRSTDSSCWIKSGKLTNTRGNNQRILIRKTVDTSKCIYFLNLQNDGNMCVYRGTGPSDNQGLIWSSNTQGKQQQSNPVYAAVNGKYGQNWIASGSTLAAGDFVGSTKGNLALIMQGDGNLVLYTFGMGSNCLTMGNDKLGGGPGANAIYDIGEVGYPSDMGKLAYIDQNSELHAYPSTNIQFQNSYTKISGIDSPGNNITGGTTSNTTVQQCQTNCNNNNSCAGFAYTSNTCYLKNNSMYPNSQSQVNPNINLYIRNTEPDTPPAGVPYTTNNIGSNQYQNYVSGGALSSSYGLASSVTPAQQAELNALQTQLDSLSQKITSLTDEFEGGSDNTASQMQTNVTGVGEYLNELNIINQKIANFGSENNGINNIIKDSDIVVLQKNYSYLFWSTLAIGSVIVAMKLSK
jgi:hypothetical protein